MGDEDVNEPALLPDAVILRVQSKFLERELSNRDLLVATAASSWAVRKRALSNGTSGREARRSAPGWISSFPSASESVS